MEGNAWNERIGIVEGNRWEIGRPSEVQHIAE